MADIPEAAVEAALRVLADMRRPLGADYTGRVRDALAAALPAIQHNRESAEELDATQDRLHALRQVVGEVIEECACRMARLDYDENPDAFQFAERLRDKLREANPTSASNGEDGSGLVGLRDELRRRAAMTPIPSSPLAEGQADGLEQAANLLDEHLSQGREEEEAVRTEVKQLRGEAVKYRRKEQETKDDEESDHASGDLPKDRTYIATWNYYQGLWKAYDNAADRLTRVLTQHQSGGSDG